MAVIRELCRNYRTVIVAPTAQNPLKKRKATSLKTRVEMIRRVLHAEGVRIVNDPHEPGVFLCEYEYRRSREFVEYWRKTYREDVDWAIGADLVGEVEQWSGGWLVENVALFIVPILPGARSTAIREGRAEAHPALKDLITAEGLYRPTQ